MIRSYSVLSLSSNKNTSADKIISIKKNFLQEQDLFYLPKLTRLFLIKNQNLKNNSLIVNDLLNTSKSLIKNSAKYKSYTTLSKNFPHSYPYNPSKSCFITSKDIKSKSIKNIFTRPYKIHKVKIKDSEINQFSFTNFIDKFNDNTNIIIKYNEYKNKYFIDKLNDGNKQVLIDLYNNYQINKKNIKEIFNNEKYNTKKNKFSLKVSNIQVCIKLTSLYIYFIDADKNINSKIKFPFELLSYYYGISFMDFRKFLATIINFDKNNFNIKYNTFQKQYVMFQSLFEFYDEDSFFAKFNNNNQREFFEINWNIETKTKNKIFNMRIIQPKISISLKCPNNKKYKFYSSIDIKTMGYLLKDNFKDWDFIILNYFSQFKIFRTEINKILCGKLSVMEESKDNNLSLNNNKITFNFNNTHNKLNTKNINSTVYHFYYSRIENNQYKNYYFRLFCPSIHISYYNFTSLIQKDFTLDIKRTRQLNKLRFSFDPEDLIKYSVVLLKEKENSKERNYEIKLSGLKAGKIRRTSTYMMGNPVIKRRSIKNCSTRSQNGINNRGNNDSKNLRRTLRLMTKLKDVGKHENIQDIKLNLDKYIFDFDEDILKFIKREKKVERKISQLDNITNLRDSIENGIKDRIRVQFGKVRLLIISQNLEENNYYFENDEMGDLVDHHPNIWEKYIIEHFDEIIKQQQYSEN